MKDEDDDTQEAYDFDLNIEIPDDEEDYPLHTPARGDKHIDLEFT